MWTLDWSWLAKVNVPSSLFTVLPSRAAVSIIDIVIVAVYHFQEVGSSVSTTLTMGK